MGLKPYVVSLEQAQDWWAGVRQMHEVSPLTVVQVSAPWGEKWKVDISPDARIMCPGMEWGRQCERLAGHGTGHPGAGLCRQHAGNSIKGMTEGFMIMAHGLADPEKIRATNVPPPQALLEEVNRTINAVRWLDEKLATATRDDQLVTRDMGEWKKDGDLAPFVRMWQAERAHLARVSVAAITAKAHEIMTQRYEAHGLLLHQILHAAMEEALADVVAGRVELDAGVITHASQILDGQIMERTGVMELTDASVENQHVEE